MIGVLRPALSVVPVGAWKMIGVSLLLLSLLAGAYWKYSHLKYELEICTASVEEKEQRILRKDAELASLRVSVVRQNDMLLDLKTTSDQRLDLVAAAKRDALASEKAAARAITALNRERGDSCADGVRLIDKALGF